MISITFLGTGTSQGVPVIGCSCVVCRSLDYRDKRLRTAVHVNIDGLSLCIDTGPDFRQQMLRENINHLDAVLFTHAHKDHTAGLDDVRAYNFMQQTDMPVYGTTPTLEQLKVEFAYAFTAEYYPGIPRIALNTIEYEPFTVQGVTVTPLPVWHHKMPVLGFRIGDFSYITDANAIPPETMERLRGSKVLVLNALQHEPHISHFSLSDALAVAAEVNAGQTFFTHMSHRLGLHADIAKTLPDNVALAFDGLQISV